MTLNKRNKLCVLEAFFFLSMIVLVFSKLQFNVKYLINDRNIVNLSSKRIKSNTVLIYSPRQLKSRLKPEREWNPEVSAVQATTIEIRTRIRHLIID